MEVCILDPSHLKQICKIHMTAFPQSALTMMGNEIVYRYYSWLFENAHDALCFGALVNTDLAGFCFSGVFNNSEIDFYRHNSLYLMGIILRQPALLFNTVIRGKTAYALRVFKISFRKKRITPRPPRQPRYGILSIAVAPEFQGQGVGALLEEAVTSDARKKGFSKMRLTVHPDNGQAIAFYEKTGWKKVLRDNLWGGLMEKSLE